MGQKKGCGKTKVGRYRGENYHYTCDEYHLCDDCKNEEKQKTLI